MIKHILDLLALDEFYGQLKQGFNQIKREIKWLKRK